MVHSCIEQNTFIKAWLELRLHSYGFSDKHTESSLVTPVAKLKSGA